ncbi:2-oxoacid:acceptor oxidoreductase subunit alpha [Oceanidesulfovibrio marinus]|uniref:2-oxoacid:acceptor oxidoreductase subunit alpha n=1 Tax=Oceanidesulfovibrio marinus TaxID=370038 RepID=A0A6P1ZB79_9BACT|nr:2-oxoacid:acceptor oxidoreductase subunit alpha [Oceanidesulfovibrio marinus]TVM30222.1 2-oxoacid:acceptor oxidoreductase subunit alpha [Oceanidesulfovibrio marinus]
MAIECINILIGGEAGQGLATVGQLLSKCLVRSGYHISVTQDYMSRVRGGHNTFAIRCSAQPVSAPLDRVDVLVALNQETVTLHKDQLGERGIALLGESMDDEGARALAVPYKQLIPKRLFENTSALGVLCALLGIDREVPAELMRQTFKKKGEDIINQNLEVLDKSMQWLRDQSPDFPALPAPPDAGREKIMINGNEAIALGAMAAGVRFCSFYPMTPSTSVALTLIANAETLGMVAEQAEDEIAAVNMGLGASFAGARAIVPTSGGGLALMCEGISLAGITETPLVFVLAMRPGPATGLPTRTEQGDLDLVLYAGHGEFPRAIFAPGDLEQCFRLTHRAFDQAEKVQGPVFVLTDQYLADNYRDVVPFDLDSLPEPVMPGESTDDPASYERYAVTESGVSPRLVPGTGEHLVVVDSDEHYPNGHITEDHGVRIEMQDKRMRKEQILKNDVVPPLLVGEEGADVLLVCWGSTQGPALEAAQLLNEQGTSAAVLHFSQVWPLVPEQYAETLDAAKKVVVVEGNATGQFATLLKIAGCFEPDGRVLRYDGLPFTAQYILERLG